MYEYENTKRIIYDFEFDDKAIFIPKCKNCGRFVKADKIILVNDEYGLKNQPNATCKKCGRIKMIFEGFF
jgi:hypothetical protein